MKKYTLKKRIAAFLIAIAITFTLSGCNSNKKEETITIDKTVSQFQQKI